MTEMSASQDHGRKQLAAVALGAGYLLGIGALIRLSRMFVDNPTTGVMVSAMVVALVAGHAGLTAGEGDASARKRALIGSGLVFAVVAVAVLVSQPLGASLGFGAPSMSALFGIAEAFAIAYVAETWLHGLPLRFARKAGVPEPVAIGYVVAAGVGAEIFVGPLEPAGVTLAMMSGTLFALMWSVTRDAWAPVAAHGIWVWSTDALLAGDVFDLGNQAGRLTHALEARGPIAWVAAAGFGVACWVVATGLVTLSRAPETEAPQRDEPEDEPDEVDEVDDDELDDDDSDG
jgi:hypothetical protein